MDAEAFLFQLPLSAMQWNRNMYYRTVLACLCFSCLKNIDRVLNSVRATKHSVTCLYNFGIPAIRSLLSVFSAAVKWLLGMLLRLKEAGCRLSFQFCDHPTIQTCPTSLHDQLCSSTWHSAFNYQYFGTQDGMLGAMYDDNMNAKLFWNWLGKGALLSLCGLQLTSTFASYICWPILIQSVHSGLSRDCIQKLDASTFATLNSWKVIIFMVTLGQEVNNGLFSWHRQKVFLMREI